MKLGDLVTLKQHCKDSGRLAIIVETPEWDKLYCRIVYLDSCGTKFIANYNNLIKLN